MAEKKEGLSDTDADPEMTFFEHLDALRPHLMRGIGALLLIAVVSFFFKDIIIDHILFGPRSPDFVTNRILCRIGTALHLEGLCINQTEFSLINTRMAGQFNLHMTVSLVTAIVLTVPYLLWELWQFIKPALTYYERRKSNRFVAYVSLCFFAGMAFGYFIIAPLTVNFLTNYLASASIQNMIDVGSYLSTVIQVSLACALVFQLPVLVYFLARMGIVSSGFMRKYRKHDIVVMAIFSAIITPPDIFSQVLVCIPLIALYEGSIRIARNVERKKEAEEAELYGNLPEEANS